MLDASSHRLRAVLRVGRDGLGGRSARRIAPVLHDRRRTDPAGTGDRSVGMRNNDQIKSRDRRIA